MKSPNRKRQVTTLTLDPEVVKEAREAGLNISRVAESAIKQALARLKNDNCPTSFEHPSSQDCDKGVAPGRGFEPLRPKGPHAFQACALNLAWLPRHQVKLETCHISAFFGCGLDIISIFADRCPVTSLLVQVSPLFRAPPRKFVWNS